MEQFQILIISLNSVHVDAHNRQILSLHLLENVNNKSKHTDYLI